jgi:putative ABC transport system substrate-binding protein
VERQAVLAQREQIRVLQERVGMNPNPSELKRALRRLKDRVDALWILNDDHLLTPRLITEAWVPGLNERPWNPAIVGAAALVSPEHSFGTFAVLPDHTALGSQAASLMFDIADNGWALPDDSSVQLPLSTTTTVDLVQVRERFRLREDALRQVDRVLE